MRAGVDRAVRASREKAHAAELSWLREDRRLAVSLAADALALVAEIEPPAEDASRLVARARAALSTAPDAALASLYLTLARAWRVRARVIDPPSRASRAVSASLVLAALVVGIVWIMRDPSVRVSSAPPLADSEWFSPAQVLDGDLGTYFSLPDRTRGWMALDYDPPVRAQELVIRNPTNDVRGLSDGHVVVRFEDGARTRAALSFPRPSMSVRVPLGGRAVTRVWISIAPRGRSAGIAEVELH